MKKLTKNLMLGLFSSTLPILGITTLTSTLVIKSSYPKFFNNINVKEDRPNNFNFQSDISAFTSFDQSIIKEEQRTPNTEVYTTSLSSQSGFKYPGYDFNYEDKNSNINEETYNKVYNERVEWNGRQWKYSDAKWIASQIYNTDGEKILDTPLTQPQLKKHPAQANFYAENVTDNTKSVTKKIRFSSNITGKVHLGLYAPAGEIIKIKLSNETFAWTQQHKANPFQIIINNSYWDNYKYGNSGQISNRYPYVRSIFNDQAGFTPATKQEYYFGTPFGGSIAINVTQILNQQYGSPMLNNAMDIELEVSGAVPELYYVHGYTTEDDWNQQLEKVKNNTITAPAFSVYSSFFSFSVPFTTTKKDTNGQISYVKSIGHTKLEEIVFPKAVFDKWQQFFFVSYYFSSKDKYEARRIDMQYCDDVWGSAGAWGGGDALYAETSWSNIFYRDPSVMTITNSWGVFHEINHNYEQNSAFFQKRDHGQTNQVSMVAYSIINDSSRFRNEEKPYGLENGSGWSKLSNGYWNIKTIQNTNQSDEYSLYAALLYSFGPYLYMDYVRDDVVNHPNTANGWTGIGEIIRLSEYFKLNLYPTFVEYGKYWQDWKEPTSLENQKIIEITRKYPIYHFNANMYATGSYLFDIDKEQFIYTGDYAAPYEIPAGLPYTFDFEKFINSTSNNFRWSKLVFDATSKNGARLKLDPNNSKKLIYTPSNPNNFNVDEFDVAIIPNANNLEVPMYKWKIKVKPNVYGVVAENVLLNNTQDFDYLRNATDVTNSRIINNFNFSPTFYTTNKEGIRIRSTFIPTTTGNYSFKGKWDDKIKIYVNNEQKFENPNWTNNQTDMFTMQMDKDKLYKIEVLVINNGGQGNFELSSYLNGTNYNIINNSISPHILELIDTIDPLKIINDPTTKYIDRSFDPYLLQGTLNKFLNKLPNIFLDSSNYTFDSSFQKNNLNHLTQPFGGPNEVWEIWTDKNIDLKINYKQTTKVPGLIFGHRTSNWTDLRPERIQITGINKTNNTKTLIYDGDYGDLKNNKNSEYVIIQFDKTYDVDELEIVFIDVDKKHGGGISLRFIQTLKTHYYGMNSLVSDSDVKYEGTWKEYVNGQSGWYKSLVNNKSKYTDVANGKLSFKIKANGFSIIGTTHTNIPQFDVYINGQKSNLAYQLEANKDNIALFYFATPKIQDLNVEIVYKSGGELIVDYITTNGNMEYSIR